MLPPDQEQLMNLLVLFQQWLRDRSDDNWAAFTRATKSLVMSQIVPVLYSLPVAFREDAVEDAAVDSYLAVIDKGPSTSFINNAAFKSWLATVARNKARDQRRLWRRRLRSEEPAHKALFLESHRCRETPTPDPEKLHRVLIAMQDLSDLENDVVTRRLMLDQSWDEIATALELPKCEVTGIFTRAIALIKHFLDRGKQ